MHIMGFDDDDDDFGGLGSFGNMGIDMDMFEGLFWGIKEIFNLTLTIKLYYMIYILILIYSRILLMIIYLFSNLY